MEAAAGGTGEVRQADHAACGNFDADLRMPAGGGARLCLLLHHTEAERER